MADGTLILLVGAPGAGTSFLARVIVQRLGAELVQTDAVRKELFPRPRYNPNEFRSVYAVCHRRISTALAAGRRVIFDATNLRERSRTTLYRIADQRAAKLIVLVARAPEDVIRHRLADRARAPDPGDLSDADWNVYLRLRGTAQPISRPHVVANTCVSPEPVLRLLCRMLEEEPARGRH